jgi:formylglycine-generating enzyme required for sulfatase activity/curved DNA-binding protein CbpA
MDDFQDYYAILGVPRNAPETEIRKAFRTRAKELHPDSHLSAEASPSINAEFRLLTEAYDTLKDAARRNAYDRDLNRQRQLTAPEEARQGRAFAKGLAAGLLIALVAIGAKVYVDRSGKFDASKSQESLRPGKAPVTEPPPVQVTQRGSDAFDGLSAIVRPPSEAAEAGDSENSVAMAGGSSAAPDGAPALASAEPGAQVSKAPVTPSGGLSPPESNETGRRSAVDPESQQTQAAKEAAPVKGPGPQSRPTAAGKFAEAIISIENDHKAGSENVAAHRLLSLVNSATAIDELTAAAAVAKRPETQTLISSRIAALREERFASSSAESAANPAQTPQDAAPGVKPRIKPGAIEIAVGTPGRENAVQITPGAGLTEGFSDCSGCPEMAVIPAGQVFIGSRPESIGFRPEEAPAHRIVIKKPLAISKHWITASDWRVCVDAGGCRPTISSFLAAGSEIAVSRVSWFDAKAYVDWLSQATGHHYRLLSEAEWEYAAQAQGRHNTGVPAKAETGIPKPLPDLSLLRYGGRARHFGALKPNGWGLYAIPGSVLEWVEDCWHPTYVQAPSEGAPWLAGAGGDCSYRVVRGGVPGGPEPDERRIVARAREFADARSPALGFRVAREVAVPAKSALGPAKTPD